MLPEYTPTYYPRTAASISAPYPDGF